MNKIIMITGANAGIGKDTARQIALLDTTKKVYLACRNEEKAKIAKRELEQKTGKKVFEIALMDVSSIDSVRKAVANLTEPIDALIMNAGGMGGKDPSKLTEDGVSQIFATNVLGHVVLVDELVKANKLNNVALYASSEGARGVKSMKMEQPSLKTSSVDEFSTIYNGSFFDDGVEEMQVYCYVKYAGTMWMNSMARKNPKIKFVTVSPGATSGTEVMNDLPLLKRFMFKHIMFPLVMPLMGMSHKLEKGAKRFVDGINNDTLKSGVFYGSKGGKLTGELVDQSQLFSDLNNESFQDNANEAIHRYIH